MDWDKITNMDVEEVLADEELVNDMLFDAWKIYEHELNNRKNEDYYINKEQMSKVIRAYKFFDRITKENDDRLEEFKINPKEENAYITAYSYCWSFYNDDVKELLDILGCASGLSIDATSDGEVCISFVIPDVYRHK